jgi:hypothetical protein
MGTGLMDDITFVGLDVHKATVAVAVAEGGRAGEARRVGVVENRPAVLAKPGRHDAGQAASCR